jgi:hypothetical protein
MGQAQSHVPVTAKTSFKPQPGGWPSAGVCVLWWATDNGRGNDQLCHSESLQVLADSQVLAL